MSAEPVRASFPRITRADLSRLTTRTIHTGKGYQASVYLVEVAGRVAAVKDYRKTPPFFRRVVGPFLLRRESKALRHLQGTRGIPCFYGVIDSQAIVMEYVEGTPIARFGRGELAPEVFERVGEAIAAIHARGVAHGDLKRRSNLILTPEGEVYLIDFAAAIIGKRPCRFFMNWLQRQVAQVDNKALPRLKKFVAPELLTPEEKYRLENPTKLEKAFRKVFNR